MYCFVFVLSFHVWRRMHCMTGQFQPLLNNYGFIYRCIVWAASLNCVVKITNGNIDRKVLTIKYTQKQAEHLFLFSFFPLLFSMWIFFFFFFFFFSSFFFFSFFKICFICCFGSKYWGNQLLELFLNSFILWVGHLKGFGCEQDLFECVLYTCQFCMACTYLYTLF